MKYKNLNEYTHADIIEMLSYIPSRPDYGEWITVISAIANHVQNDVVAEQILSTHFREEKKGELRYKIQKRTSKHSLKSLIKLAKESGMKFDGSDDNKEKNFNTKNFVAEKKKYQLPEKKQAYYSFYDPEARDYMTSLLRNGTNRLDACSQVLDKFPDTPKEREYLFCINRSIINKNCNASIFRKKQEIKKLDDYTMLNSNFKIVSLTKSYLSEGLTKIIGSGYSMVFSYLKNNSGHVLKRSAENFISADLFAIDIDNVVKLTKKRKTDEEGYLSLAKAIEMPLSREAICLYSTPSDTDEHNRFRVIFEIDETITNAELLKDVMKSIGVNYGADEQTTSEANVFYGNTNAMIYIPNTSEVLNYKNGVLDGH